MKEQIYETIKKADTRYFGWYNCKKSSLDINRYKFHKLCGELVAEGRLGTEKYSGIIVYFILNDSAAVGN